MMRIEISSGLCPSYQKVGKDITEIDDVFVPEESFCEEDYPRTKFWLWYPGILMIASGIMCWAVVAGFSIFVEAPEIWKANIINGAGFILAQLGIILSLASNPEKVRYKIEAWQQRWGL